MLIYKTDRQTQRERQTDRPTKGENLSAEDLDLDPDLPVDDLDLDPWSRIH